MGATALNTFEKVPSPLSVITFSAEVSGLGSQRVPQSSETPATTYTASPTGSVAGTVVSGSVAGTVVSGSVATVVSGSVATVVASVTGSVSTGFVAAGS